jgi:hypothetical protein
MLQGATRRFQKRPAGGEGTQEGTQEGALEEEGGEDGAESSGAAAAGSRSSLLDSRPSLARAGGAEFGPGAAPAFVLGIAPRLHDAFARHAEVDLARQLAFEAAVAEAEVGGSRSRLAGREGALIRRLGGVEGEDEGGRWKRMHVSQHGGISAAVGYFKKVKDGDLWGKAEGVIDASPARVLGWFWMSCTHERMQLHKKTNGHRLKTEIKIKDSHSMITISVTKTVAALDDRLFAFWWAWARLEGGDLALAFGDPEDDFGAGEEEVGLALRYIAEAKFATVRQKARGFIRLRELGPRLCELSYVFNGHFGTCERDGRS